MHVVVSEFLIGHESISLKFCIFGKDDCNSLCKFMAMLHIWWKDPQTKYHEYIALAYGFALHEEYCLHWSNTDDLMRAMEKTRYAHIAHVKFQLVGIHNSAKRTGLSEQNDVWANLSNNNKSQQYCRSWLPYKFLYNRKNM